VQRRTAVPSAAHYVGYVEDDETPEMIMKKFEAMEHILAGAGTAAAGPPALTPPLAAAAEAAAAEAHPRRPSTDPEACSVPPQKEEEMEAEDDHPQAGGPDPITTAAAAAAGAAPLLDDSHLEAIFKATSIFNVRSVLAGNEALLRENAGGGGGRPHPSAPSNSKKNRQRRDAAARAATLAGEVGADDRAYSDDAGDLFVSGEDDDDAEEEEDLEFLRGFWSDGERWEHEGAKARRRGGGANAAAALARQQQREERRAAREATRAAKAAEREARKAERAAARAAAGGRGGGGRGGGGGGGRGGGRSTSSSSVPRPAPAVTTHQHNARDAEAALLRRRLKAAAAAARAAEGGVAQVRVPPLPLPSAWGRAVAAFAGRRFSRPVYALATAPAAATTAAAPEAAAAPPPPPPVVPPPPTPPPPPAAAYAESRDLTTLDFERLLPARHGREYLAVLINSGWEEDEEEEDENEANESDDPIALASRIFARAVARRAAAARRLRALPLPKLCPRGFVFVWSRKEHIAAVVDALSSMQYVYVESLAWVLLSPGNRVLRLPARAASRAAAARSSHRTLLIFRRADGAAPGTRDIELRHQRSPDVVLDCVVAASGGKGWRVPAQVYAAIETMLPTSGCVGGGGGGSAGGGEGEGGVGVGIAVGGRLELWAERQEWRGQRTARRRDLREPPPAVGRAGWAHVAEVEG
jgi:hypothetical protein